MVYYWAIWSPWRVCDLEIHIWGSSKSSTHFHRNFMDQGDPRVNATWLRWPIVFEKFLCKYKKSKQTIKWRRYFLVWTSNFPWVGHIVFSGIQICQSSWLIKSALYNLLNISFLLTKWTRIICWKESNQICDYVAYKQIACLKCKLEATKWKHIQTKVRGL